MKKWCLAVLLCLTAVAQARDPHIVVVGLMADRAVVKVDGQQMLLHVGDSQNGVELLSVNAQEAVLKVGGHERHFGLGMDVGAITPYVAASVDIPMNKKGQFMTVGEIDGHGVAMLVDTGANSVSMTTAQAQELGIDYERGHPGTAETAGGSVQAWLVVLPTVKVGPLVEHDVQASVLNIDTKTPVLLGMTFLSRVSLQQDKDRLHLSAR